MLMLENLNSIKGYVQQEVNLPLTFLQPLFLSYGTFILSKDVASFPPIF